MKAIFIGADGSLGLKHGRTYDIKAISISRYPVTLRIDGVGICPYSSFETLLANWNLLMK